MFITRLMGQSLIVITVVIMSISAMLASCGGSNPAFAPFGSTVSMIKPPDGITIPPNSLEPLLISAIVLDPEGFPLNNVRVIWDLSFANQNSLVVDTNGDGISDARAIQLVNNRACSPQQCMSTPISEWFGQGAFVDSPFDIVTDERGLGEVIILVSGDVVIDPAVLQISTESGAIDIAEFDVNGDQS